MSGSAPMSRPRPSRITPWSSAISTRIIRPAPPARLSFRSPGSECTVRCPPARSARSASSVSPTWPSASRRSRSGAAKPRPSSRTTSRTRPGSARVTVTSTRSRAGVRLDVAQRLARDAVDERVARLRAGGVDLQAGGDPRRLERAEQIAERRLQAGRREVRRVDLDEQRAQVANALAQPGDRGAQHARLLGVVAAVRRLGERREPERHAREILDDPVVQVGGDPPPLLRGRLDRVLEQLLALAVAALQPARHRPRERDLEEQQHEQSGEQRRRERAQQARAARAHASRSAGRSRTAPACRSACGSACTPRAACPRSARAGSPAGSGRSAPPASRRCAAAPARPRRARSAGRSATARRSTGSSRSATRP